MAVPGDEKAFLKTTEEGLEKIRAMDGPKPTTMAVYKMDAGNFMVLASYNSDADRMSFSGKRTQLRAEMDQDPNLPRIIEQRVLLNMGARSFVDEVRFPKSGDRVGVSVAAFKSPMHAQDWTNNYTDEKVALMDGDYLKAGVRVAVGYQSSPTAYVIMHHLSDGGEAAHKDKKTGSLAVGMKAFQLSGILDPTTHLNTDGVPAEPNYATCVFFGVVDQKGMDR